MLNCVKTVSISVFHFILRQSYNDATDECRKIENLCYVHCEARGALKYCFIVVLCVHSAYRINHDHSNASWVVWNYENTLHGWSAHFIYCFSANTMVLRQWLNFIASLWGIQIIFYFFYCVPGGSNYVGITSDLVMTWVYGSFFKYKFSTYFK